MVVKMTCLLGGLQVVCSKCSTRRLPLAYDEGRENKVCDDCYAVLQPSEAETPTVGESSPRRKAPGALQVCWQNTSLRPLSVKQDLSSS